MELNKLKVAIVHDYLHVFGGAEGVVQAIWELFPDADIYTATYDKAAMEKAGALRGAKIFYPTWKNSFSGKFGKFIHKVLIANLPFYFQNLDLSKYDLVLSSSAHFAKGVRTSSSQLHISYIHTPPRFLYGYAGEIRKRSFFFWRILLWPLDAYLRTLDKKFAMRPNYLLCNSETVRERIHKIYGRDATVIYPFPNAKVDDSLITMSGDFYLIVSRLAAYKNIDLAIKVCGKNKIPLKIAGTGSDEKMLKDLASEFESVQMLGFVDEAEKANLYANCKAVICATKDEDFGMAALEPMMFGKPVIALNQGGLKETVIAGLSGVLFDDLTESSLEQALKKLNDINFDAVKIKAHASKFSKDRFKNEYMEFVMRKLEQI